MKYGTSALILPMNIQGWFLLGLTCLISLLSKELSIVFSRTVWKYQLFGPQSSLWSNAQNTLRMPLRLRIPGIKSCTTQFHGWPNPPSLQSSLPLQYYSWDQLLITTSTFTTLVYVATISHLNFWNNFLLYFPDMNLAPCRQFWKWKNSVKYNLDYEALLFRPSWASSGLQDPFTFYLPLLFIWPHHLYSPPCSHFSIQGGLSPVLWTHQARSSLMLFLLVPPSACSLFSQTSSWPAPSLPFEVETLPDTTLSHLLNFYLYLQANCHLHTFFICTFIVCPASLEQTSRTTRVSMSIF